MKWASEDYSRTRTLSDEFTSLGIALVRGTFSQIANAIFKVKRLKVEITKCLLRELSRECRELTSKKKPSILRKTTADDIRQFELRKVCEELKHVADKCCPKYKKARHECTRFSSKCSCGWVNTYEREVYVS